MNRQFSKKYAENVVYKWNDAVSLFGVFSLRLGTLRIVVAA